MLWYLPLQIILCLSQLLCGIESCILNSISAATHVWSRRQPGWSSLFRLVLPLSFAGPHEGQNIIPPLKRTDCGQFRKGVAVRWWGFGFFSPLHSNVVRLEGASILRKTKQMICLVWKYGFVVLPQAKLESITFKKDLFCLLLRQLPLLVFFLQVWKWRSTDRIVDVCGPTSSGWNYSSGESNC